MTDKSSRKDLLFDAWSALFENTTDMLFIKNTDLTYAGASRRYANLLGLDDPHDILGKTDFELFKEKETAELYATRDRHTLETGEDQRELVESIIPPDGKPRHVVASKIAIRDCGGAIVGLLGELHDVTIARATQQRYDSELRFLLDDVPEDACMAVLIDVTAWTIMEKHIFPHAVDVLTDFSSVDEYFQCMADAVVEDEEALRYFSSFSKQYMRRLYEQGRLGVTLEYLRKTPCGGTLWVRDETRFLTEPGTGHLISVVTIRDIDRERRKQADLVRAAECDAMTGLLNHDVTLQKIARFLKDEGRAGTHALIMLDLDNFKHVNDTFGHQKGDEVIKKLAAVISSAFRSSDIVGRVGGDEFLAMMKNVTDRRQVRHKAEELISILQMVCVVGENTIAISASIGVNLYTGDGAAFASVLAGTDAALYRAKRLGRCCFAFCSDEPIEGEMIESPQYTSIISFQYLLEHMNGGVVLVENSGGLRLLYASPTCFRLIHQSPGAFCSQGELLLEAVVPEDRPILCAALIQALRVGAPSSVLFRVRLPDGQLRHVQLRTSPAPNPGGAPRICGLATSVEELFYRSELPNAVNCTGS